jgi:hypothetical protein
VGLGVDDKTHFHARSLLHNADSAQCVSLACAISLAHAKCLSCATQLVKHLKRLMFYCTFNKFNLNVPLFTVWYAHTQRVTHACFLEHAYTLWYVVLCTVHSTRMHAFSGTLRFTRYNTYTPKNTAHSCKRHFVQLSSERAWRSICIMYSAA